MLLILYELALYLKSRNKAFVYSHHNFYFKKYFYAILEMMFHTLLVLSSLH